MRYRWGILLTIILILVVTTLMGVDDTDGDGIADNDEVTYGYNPLDPDTDADGLCDGDIAVYNGSTLLCAAGEDLNTDGDVDTGETDPCDPDTDGDGFSDGDEVNLFDTDPTVYSGDTDDDYLPDEVETDDESFNDLTDTGTDPYEPNTDGDSIWDGVEALQGSDPLSADITPDAFELGDDSRITYDSGTSQFPSLVAGNTWHGLVWNDDRSGNDEIYFRRLGFDGSTIAGDLRLTEDANSSQRASIAWDGEGFGIVWQDNRDGNYEIYFSRVAGGETTVAETRLSYNGQASYAPSVAWSGSEFGVVWHDDRDSDYEIYFTRVTAGGSYYADVGITSDDTYPSMAPRLAWTGSEYGVVWIDDRDGAWEVYFTRVTAGGSYYADVRISYNSNPDEAPDIRWNGESFGIAWVQELASNTCEIMFQRVLADGTTINPPQEVTSTGGGKSWVRLDWNGNSFTAVWYDDSLGSNNEIYAVGIHPLGYASTGVLRLTNDSNNSMYPDIAWDGVWFGVAWQDNRDGNDEIYFTTLELDYDGDSLTDSDEIANGTDPADWDSDDDGLADGYEVYTYDTDPLDPDTDNDGLIDGEEVNIYGTDPDDIDTDNDGMDDGWEVEHSGCLQALTADERADPDNDGGINEGEYLYHITYSISADPCNYDTDGDGLGDAFEVGVVVGPGPDGVLDSLPPSGDDVNMLWDAILFGPDMWPQTTALDDDTQVIPLDISYPQLFETLPDDPDTDGDGVWDGVEVFQGSNPLAATIMPDAYEVGDDVRITYDSGVSQETSIAAGATWHGLVWRDDRSGNDEIYFRRVGFDGTTLDSDIRITTATGIGQRPSIVWDGAAFGVSWHDNRDGNNEIYFARVDSLGNKLNGGADSRLTNNSGNSIRPDLAWSGSSYGVSWCDNKSGSYDVYFTRVTAGGTPVGGEILVSGGSGNNSDYPRVSWSGSEYGLAWYDNRDGIWEIYFARVTAGGTPVGGEVRVSYDSNSSSYPDIQWNGESFGIAWLQDNEIWFRRVGEDGTTVTPPYQLTSTGGIKGQYWGVRLDSDGNSFAAVWYDSTHDSNNEIYAVGIHPLGYASTGVLRLTNDSGGSKYPEIAWDGERFGVAWQDTRAIDNQEIFFTRFELDQDGDGLTDNDEPIYGTDPDDWDSDGDGLGDGDELYIYGYDPLDQYSDWDATPDGDEDYDGDGLTNVEEFRDYNTDPANPDTDGDGFTDEDEINLFETDPNVLNLDSDSDGLPNDVETNTDVYVGDTNTGTDPNDNDTDGDGFTDGEEVLIFNTDPNNGSNLDSDSDGLPDEFEDMDGDSVVDFNETDPDDWDTDGDSICDGAEVFHGSDPLDPDIMPAAYKVGNDVRVTYDEDDSWYPSIAAGALWYGLVWQDYRYDAPGGNAMTEVFFSRVGFDGSVLGHDQQFTSAVEASDYPSIVWGGQSFAVAWSDARNKATNMAYFTRADSTGSKRVEDVRVSYGANAGWYPDIDWNDCSYGVTWYEYLTDHSHEIFFRVMDTDGTSLTEDKLISSNDDKLSKHPRISWSGSEYGAVWIDYRNDQAEIYFRRIASDGEPEGDEVRISYDSNDSLCPDIQWNGESFGIAWVQDMDGPDEIWFRQVQADGTTIPDRRLTWTTEKYKGGTGCRFRLAWNGSAFGAVWHEITGDIKEVYGMAFDSRGFALTDILPISAAYNDSSYPDISSDGTRFGVAWQDNRNGNYDIYFSSFELDQDGDSLYDSEEILCETDPADWNTDDGNTTPDGYDDEDNDGLSNKDEVRTYHTDPVNPDTDGDGLCDGATSVQVGSTVICVNGESTEGTDPLDPDSDDDGLCDGLTSVYDGYTPICANGESTLGTDPDDPDTDGDGLSDYYEICYDGDCNYSSTTDPDPLDPDTDGDGLSDGEEVYIFYGLTGDLDTDGKSNGPLDDDSDDDSSTDGAEVAADTDPLDDSPSAPYPDADGDTLMDDAETNIGTNPSLSDTDGDGLTDYAELVILKTDPLDPDTDGDGLCDGNTHVEDGGTLVCSAGEDMDLDGVVDSGETDPRTPTLEIQAHSGYGSGGGVVYKGYCDSDVNFDVKVLNGSTDIDYVEASLYYCDGMLKNIGECSSSGSNNYSCDFGRTSRLWDGCYELRYEAFDDSEPPALLGADTLRVVYSLDLDFDGDGLSDLAEKSSKFTVGGCAGVAVQECFQLDPCVFTYYGNTVPVPVGEADPDGDHLTNSDEWEYGTKPYCQDTDSDGLMDDDEVYYILSSPSNPNSDDEGYTDGYEAVPAFCVYDICTDPNDPDTDDDGFLDREEISYFGTDPNVYDADSAPEDCYPDSLGVPVPAKGKGIAIPFELHLLEMGPDGSTLPPVNGPGKMTFDQAAGALDSNFNSLWDDSSSAFPLNNFPACYGRDPNQRYSVRSVYTVDGEGFLHFNVRDNCSSMSTQPCLVAGATYTITTEHGPEYSLDTAKIEIELDGNTADYAIYDEEGNPVSGSTLVLELGHVVDTRGYMSSVLREINKWYYSQVMPGDDSKVNSITRLANGYDSWVRPARNAYVYDSEALYELGADAWDRGLPVSGYHTYYHFDEMHHRNLEEDTINSPAGEIDYGHFITFPIYPYRVDPEKYGQCVDVEDADSLFDNCYWNDSNNQSETLALDQCGLSREVALEPCINLNDLEKDPPMDTCINPWRFSNRESGRYCVKGTTVNGQLSLTDELCFDPALHAGDITTCDPFDDSEQGKKLNCPVATYYTPEYIEQPMLIAWLSDIPFYSIKEYGSETYQLQQVLYPSEDLDDPFRYTSPPPPDLPPAFPISQLFIKTQRQREASGGNPVFILVAQPQYGAYLHGFSQYYDRCEDTSTNAIIDENGIVAEDLELINGMFYYHDTNLAEDTEKCLRVCGCILNSSSNCVTIMGRDNTSYTCAEAKDTPGTANCVSSRYSCDFYDRCYKYGPCDWDRLMCDQYPERCFRELCKGDANCNLAACEAIFNDCNPANPINHNLDFCFKDHPECQPNPGGCVPYGYIATNDRVDTSDWDWGYVNWRDDFNGIEYARDYCGDYILPKWYALLNQGYRYSLTAISNLTSIGRTYARSPVDSPGDFQGSRQELVNTMVQNMIDGGVIISEGLFIRVNYQGQDVVGKTIVFNGDTITFHLIIEGRMDDDYDRSQTITWVVNGGTPETQPVTLQEVYTPVGYKLRAEEDIDVSIGEDSWVVFRVDPDFALANPVWIDYDGGGFTPINARPVIHDVALLNSEGSTIDRIVQGDTLQIRFKIGDSESDPDTCDGISILERNWSTASNPAVYVAGNIATPVLCYGCSCTYSYLTGDEGVLDELEGPDNEVKITVANQSGYRGWYYDTIEIIYTDNYGGAANGLPDWFEKKYEIKDGSTALSDPLGDYDGDGMADWYEYKFSGNATDLDPCADNDDGAYRRNINIIEFLVNNNPTDPTINISYETAYRFDPLFGYKDGDSCPRWWEEKYGLDDGGSVCQDVDSDGDGVMDYDEYISGADPLKADSDGDSLSDYQEVCHDGDCGSYAAGQDTNPLVKDTDGDGLSDYQEYCYDGNCDGYSVDNDTDPLNPNTDNHQNDALPDGWESSYDCMDPLMHSNGSNQDHDNDYLNNLEEYQIGTDPCNADTDGDGLCDGSTDVYDGGTLLCSDGEISEGTNPLDPDTDNDGLCDGSTDVYDGYTLLCIDGESTVGTDPLDPDSDDDGILDGYEITVTNTEPDVADSDTDGMPDGWEITNGLQGLTADADLDLDGDGLSNVTEYNSGVDSTKANSPDTDGDGLCDGATSVYDGSTPVCANGESTMGTDPLKADSDGDGLNDYQEVCHDGDCTAYTPATDVDPLDPDTDGDTLSDYQEYCYDGDCNAYASETDLNPLDPDTDDDGMHDGWEFNYDLQPGCTIYPLSGDSASDMDSDGLNNLSEYNNGTNPCDPDSDDDGLSDEEEVVSGADGYTTDPLDPDSDDDGLCDGKSKVYDGGILLCVNGETVWPSDPNDPDSDNDGLCDGNTSVYDGSTLICTNGEYTKGGSDPNDPDSDDDGLCDGSQAVSGICIDGESTEGTSPNFSDTDGDTLSDYDEVITYLTDPTDPDTDGDGVWDGVEALQGSDPLSDQITPAAYEVGNGDDTRITYDGDTSRETSIAAGDTWYGLVWNDNRSGNEEIYFRRVGFDGSTLGGDIRITSATGASQRPSIVWDGATFGVAWNDNHDGNNEIYFTRVSSLGQKDPVGDVRISYNANNSIYPDIAWNGSSYGVTWYDNRSSSSKYEVYYIAVDVDGSTLTDEILVSNKQPGSDSSHPRISWSGSEYGVVWEDYYHGKPEIYFIRIADNGTLQGATVRITFTSTYSTYPDIHWNGDSFGITWIQDQGGSADEGPQEIMFKRVPADGSTINAAYQLTSTGGEKGDLWGLRLGWNGNSYAVVWHDNSQGSNNEIYAVGVHPLGYASTGILRLTDNSNGSIYPDIAWGDTWFGVTWQDDRDGNDEIYFTRFELDRDGDSITDNNETTYGTAPLDFDTDGDGMDDGWEVTYEVIYGATCIDPLVGDSLGDFDNDTYTNLQEYNAVPKTNPCVAE